MPSVYTLPPTSQETCHPRPRGGPPAPRPPRAFPGPPRAPSATSPPGRDSQNVAGAGRRGGRVPGQSRRERPWSFPPARSGTAGLGNPLTQISLYGIHPVRGGVTDGKRSRLQPSAAGGRAARGTGPDGTVRDATAPPPPAWRDPARALGHRHCPSGCCPAAGDPLPSAGSRTALPRSKVLQGRRRRRGPAGQGCALRCKSSPISSTERGLPVAGHRYSAGPTHGKLNLRPSLQRGARYAHVSLLTCLLCTFVIVESEGNGTGRWEAPQGSLRGRRPPGMLGELGSSAGEGGVG